MQKTQQDGLSFFKFGDAARVEQERPDSDVATTDGYAYVQEGGSSAEVYVHVFDDSTSAHQGRIGCAEGSYRTSEVITVPAKFNNSEFYNLVELFLQASLVVEYPGM